MARLFDKYYGVLRRMKANYVLANLSNASKLKINQKELRKQGLNHSVYLPIDSTAFYRDESLEPWMDKPYTDHTFIDKLKKYRFSDEVKQQLSNFEKNGFMILKSFLTKAEVDEANAELQRLIDEGIVDYNFTGRKVMFAFQKSELLRSIVEKMEIIEILQFILEKKVKPFQTINFIQPSEQRAHSDIIHMTTQPLGYMVAAWFALEDIGLDQGPIFYYPGSHKLPYVLNSSYNHGGSRWMIGPEAYLNYENYLEAIIKKENLQKEYFTPEAGDVLIWHGNLIHGGSKWNDKQQTRKSMVCHYFTEDVVCYHELTQRFAYIKQ